MKIILSLIVAGGLGVFVARADTLVAPSDRATQSGNNSVFGGFGSPGQFQAVYTAVNFSSAFRISAMTFRMDEGSGNQSLGTVIPRLTVNFSTYHGTIETFRPNNYNLNKGSDDTVVYDSSISWTSTDLPGATPNPFDLRVQFSQPFTYDPTQGALLMNWNAPGPWSGTISVDADSRDDPRIGWIGTGANARFTIVTQFEVTAVPEPGAAALLIFGIGAVFFSQKRK